MGVGYGRAYFDDARAGAGCDEGSGRADIECIVPVAACPDNVHDKVLVGVLDHRFECARTQHLGSCDEALWLLLYLLNVHRSEKGADLCGGQSIGGKEMLECELEVIRCELLGRLDDLFEQRSERGGRVL